MTSFRQIRSGTNKREEERAIASSIESVAKTYQLIRPSEPSKLSRSSSHEYTLLRTTLYLSHLHSELRLTCGLVSEPTRS